MHMRVHVQVRAHSYAYILYPVVASLFHYRFLVISSDVPVQHISSDHCGGQLSFYNDAMLVGVTLLDLQKQQ